MLFWLLGGVLWSHDYLPNYFTPWNIFWNFLLLFCNEVCVQLAWYLSCSMEPFLMRLALLTLSLPLFAGCFAVERGQWGGDRLPANYTKYQFLIPPGEKCISVLARWKRASIFKLITAKELLWNNRHNAILPLSATLTDAYRDKFKISTTVSILHSLIMYMHIILTWGLLTLENKAYSRTKALIIKLL